MLEKTLLIERLDSTSNLAVNHFGLRSRQRVLQRQIFQNTARDLPAQQHQPWMPCHTSHLPEAPKNANASAQLIKPVLDSLVLKEEMGEWIPMKSPSKVSCSNPYNSFQSRLRASELRLSARGLADLDPNRQRPCDTRAMHGLGFASILHSCCHQDAGIAQQFRKRTSPALTDAMKDQKRSRTMRESYTRR